jgi:hypothetical protein
LLIDNHRNLPPISCHQLGSLHLLTLLSSDVGEHSASYCFVMQKPSQQHHHITVCLPPIPQHQPGALLTLGLCHSPILTNRLRHVLSCRGRARSIITSSSPAAYSPTSAGGAAPSGPNTSGGAATTPILSGSEWELDASSTAIRIVGGSSSSDAKAAPSGSSTPSAAAAAAGVVHVFDEYEEDVPPLDLGVLRGQVVTPGNAGLLLQGEQRRCAVFVCCGFCFTRRIVL